MHPKTILVVDDNPHERDIFANYLRFVGFAVVEACDGKEGLQRAEEYQPDLILLDITMPVMDGWETMGRLQEDSSTALIPVIALTALRLEEERMEELGFCGYLEKPLVPFRVLEEVERCIGPAVVTADATAYASSGDPSRSRL